MKIHRERERERRKREEKENKKSLERVQKSCKREKIFLEGEKK